MPMKDGKTKNKNPRKLQELEVKEVSLVDRPAIRRQFLVVKREENVMSQDLETTEFAQGELFEMDPVLEVTKDEQVAEENQSEEVISEKAEQAELFVAKEEVATDPQNQVEDAESSAPNKKVNKKETLKMAEAPSIPVSFQKRDDGSYDLTGVPAEMQATVEQLCKAQDAAIEKAAELEEILKAERDERLRRDFVEKAEKEYQNIPGTSVEIGLLLKSLNDLDAEVAQKVEDIFKATNAQLGGTEILKEVGTAVAESEVSAWGKIEQIAGELMSANGLSKATAISKALELNPKLYSEYLQEGK